MALRAAALALAFGAVASQRRQHGRWGSASASQAGRAARVAAALRRLDAQPALVAATQRARRRLPGDSSYGDPLSTAGPNAPDVLARQLVALSGERPSVARELGMGALQLWQGLAEAQGRGYGERELAIMFTDLVDFSAWALQAGDASAVELLRRVDLAVSTAIAARGGEVVKRLGDGLMAVFDGAQAAVQAGHSACQAVSALQLDGYRPRLRVGIHMGRPRRLGGDYFGVDVNVAARIAAAAGGEEVLVSERLAAQLDRSRLELQRRRGFAAKGAPQDLRVYRARPLAGAP